MNKPPPQKLFEDSQLVRATVRREIEESRALSKAFAGRQVVGRDGEERVYRLHLTREHGTIWASGTFPAADDVGANLIACVICDASEGDFEGYELWRGEVCLTFAPKRHRSAEKLTIDALDAARELAIIDLEDQLQRSYACIASSKALMARLDEMKSRRDAAGEPGAAG
jgi:hypothetical protein